MKTNKISLKNTIRQLKQCISSKCLECVCYNSHEVLLCEIKKCSLFSNKPISIDGLYTLSKKIKKAEANNMDISAKTSNLEIV